MSTAAEGRRPAYQHQHGSWCAVEKRVATTAAEGLRLWGASIEMCASTWPGAQMLLVRELCGEAVRGGGVVLGGVVAAAAGEGEGNDCFGRYGRRGGVWRFRSFTQRLLSGQ